MAKWNVTNDSELRPSRGGCKDRDRRQSSHPGPHRGRSRRTTPRWQDRSSALRLRVCWAIGCEDVRRLGGHICAWLVQGDGRLAVVLCGMDESVDFGRGPRQAGLADPAAGAACLASVPKPDHDDHTSSARQITHCRRVTTLSWRDCTPGCSAEPWLPPPSDWWVSRTEWMPLGRRY